MSFVRILMLVVAALAVVVVGLAMFRPDPETDPAPQTRETPRAPQAPPRTVTAPSQPFSQQPTSPGDASSSAEMTAEEAAEAVRRLDQEREENAMGPPESMPAHLPPHLAPAEPAEQAEPAPAN